MLQDFVSTRRQFLQRGLTLLAASSTVPLFLDQTVRAINNPADLPRTQQPSGKDGKILVVVQLAGGNDGLSMVVPFGDDAYYKARPTIGHDAKTVLKLSDYVGLNPNLGPLKGLFDAGSLGVVQGVGYPNPNRSHFRATDIWESAAPEREIETTGWIGRYFDNSCPGCDPHVGISIGSQLPLAMQGERVLPLTFEKPDAYRYNGPDKPDYVSLNHHDSLMGATTRPSAAMRRPSLASLSKPEITAASQLDFLHRTAMDAQVSSDDILRMTKGFAASGKYPNDDFGSSLKTIAAMIGGGLPTRVYYCTLGGFDTHANQKGRHDQLMTTLGQGINAFWADMKQQRNDDRVMVMTFSEFGRRVQQNASGGTDHGAAAPMFVVGKNVRQGLIGTHPSLTDLDAGDLKYKVDFRSVYTSILQDWMGTPAQPILGAQFPTLPIVRV